MPNLTVFAPRNDAVVNLNQPFQVSGEATDLGMPEPVLIDSVTVRVDGGPVIDAKLTMVPKPKQTIVNFSASAEVTGGQDPHTVTATNDQERSATQTVSVFTGPAFEVDALWSKSSMSSRLIPLTPSKSPYSITWRAKCLRGLAARCIATTERPRIFPQVVNFYHQRFQMGLTPEQMEDLINFLETL